MEENKNNAEVGNETKKNLKIPKYLLIGIIGLQVIALVVTMFILKGRGASGGGGEGSSSSSLLPIWVAVFIPIIPAAFVEPDETAVKKQSDIVQYSIFAAGPMANVALALIVLLLSNLIFSPIEANISEPIGFSFNVQEDLPAAQAGIESGTIISKVNGKLVTDGNQLSGQLYYASSPGETITLSSATQDYAVTLTNHPNNPERGYLGVVNVKNEIRIKEGYEQWKGIFFWFKDLFKWLFLLNLFVGLINLLPLGIVDGGRMLQVLLSKLIKNQAKAMKVWGFISLLFVALLVIGLAGTYLKPLFS